MSGITPQDGSTSLHPITTTSYPFDKANTDIILRTSDHVDFHIYSQILMAASPFFEGMLTVPQPPSDQQQLKHGRPIIHVSESSKALDPLLRICYPINKPKERSLEEIELALAAAMKFEMELPTTILTGELHALAETFPLEVWGIACRLRLESVARFAGNVTLNNRLDFTVLRDMEGITAANYFRLREFIRLQGEVPLDFKFLSPGSSPKHSRPPSSVIANLALADAPPPDIICRSADGIEFRAHKAVLSVTSAALRDKISSASSPAPETNASGEPALSVIQFEEESTVLHAMFQLSYHCPTDVQLPPDLVDLTAILGTVEKYRLYSMHPAVWSLWRAMASTNPLRAYCLAIHAGHMLGTKEAARLVLNQVLDGVYVEELEYTPAVAYHRLLNYYEKCCVMREQQLTKLDASLKVPPMPPSEPSTPIDPWGYTPKKKMASSKKMSTGSKTPIATPGATWLQHYLRDIRSRLHSPPKSIMPELSELLTEATKTGRQDSRSYPRAWCQECQAVVEGILEVSKVLQQLSDDLNNVELEI